jgi:urease accessory protein UreE
MKHWPTALCERWRLMVQSGKGAEVMITLSSDQKFHDSVVPVLNDHRTAVIRANKQRWLRLTPCLVSCASDLAIAPTISNRRGYSGRSATD